MEKGRGSAGINGRENGTGGAWAFIKRRDGEEEEEGKSGKLVLEFNRRQGGICKHQCLFLLFSLNIFGYRKGYMEIKIFLGDIYSVHEKRVFFLGGLLNIRCEFFGVKMVWVIVRFYIILIQTLRI